MRASKAVIEFYERSVLESISGLFRELSSFELNLAYVVSMQCLLISVRDITPSCWYCYYLYFSVLFDLILHFDLCFPVGLHFSVLSVSTHQM